ncbi:SIS domain-containing protein, partial [Halomonas sp. 707D4]
MPASSGLSSALRESALRTLHIEQAAINDLKEKLDEGFDRACSLILACQGRVVVTGMGKSGHIAGKLAATLASTGTPAFFVHPGEASHGDLGMITKTDVVLALSNSGETAEVTALLPLLKRLGVPLISMTGRPGSTLGTHADAHLDSGVAREACPLDLAPTSSTTAALALGDA